MVQGAISPERMDYFADGKYKNERFYIFIFSVCKKNFKLALLKIIRGYADTEFLFVGVWLHGYTSSTYVLFS
jgi:hypothetical protein